ncbi:GNAT family N-acetyltransferase [Sphingomonas sp. FW199]|uniref:GNAT family N-acetyltransferase n=1 Tax=Sphingomonas sp. FW199 TaxID=3400217 RepID=UPI003CEAF967
MFVRTQRLMLRPGWTDDAAELAHAMGHWDVVRHLSRAPWPYGIADAQAFLGQMQAGRDAASFLICSRDGDAAPIIGGIGYGPFEDRPTEFGYWLTPQAWGRGYATEAGHAVIALARTMGVRRLTASHFIDNLASGRVLARLGFTPTGRSPGWSAARQGHAECIDMALSLTAEQQTDDDRPLAQMAA